MDSMRRGIILTVLAVLVVAGGAYLYLRADQSTPDGRVVWLIPQDPYAAFNSLEAAFNRGLRDDVEKRFTPVLMKSRDFGQSLRPMTMKEVLALMERGEVQIASVRVTELLEYEPRLAFLGLPYLFNDEDEAMDFLNGGAGAFLGAAIDKKSPVRLIAFMERGGMHMLESNHKLFDDAGDFERAHIASPYGRVERSTLQTLGARVDIVEVARPGRAAMLETFDGAEMQYSRIFPDVASPRYVTETNHALSFLAVVVSKQFYDSLSADDVAVLRRSVDSVVQAARDETRLLQEKTKEQLKASGTIIVPLTESQRLQLRHGTAPVYDAYRASLTKEFIAALTALRQ